MKNLIIRIAAAVFCVIAVAGYALPAVNVHLSFFGATRTFDFGMRTPFEEYGVFDRLDLAGSDLADILAESDVVRDITRRIIFGVAAYLLALILFAVAAADCFFEKLRRVPQIILPAAALALHIFAARAVLSIPEIVADALDDILGILARLLNTREILQIELAAGYWVTLAAISAILILEITRRE